MNNKNTINNMLYSNITIEFENDDGTVSVGEKVGDFEVTHDILKKWMSVMNFCLIIFLDQY